ncbi:hypothetical protein F0562_033248 [Nyssa sinensis]|uniref:Alpha-L-fucosidase n=1 Tax=Nyssa sinensis TaxID=561372 RepID=A0A5J5ASD5_9ASTE|nr:hypothetical protein F0562_033248 [Nyssa sinensis]
MEWVRLPIRGWKALWGLKKSRELVSVLVVAVSIFMAMGPRKWNFGQSSGCNFPAVYNCGDSNSDTGGRYIDGQVIIDLIAQKLGLPYLSAYLDSIAANFQHGANFATGGSTIQPVDSRIFEAGFSPISLDIQLMQFEQFKERINELYKFSGKSSIKRGFPRLDCFSKALYILDIGQNDLYAGFKYSTEMQVLTSIPNITNLFALVVEKLYQHGARNFWVHNTGPIGCLPFSVINNPQNTENADENGCVRSHNEVAKEFNRQLKETVSRLSAQLSDAVLIYVDIYSAKYTLITEAKQHGFANPIGYCCGHNGDYFMHCGMKGMVNGTEVYGASCSDPSTYISWDGMHYSHAANQWIANHIMDGSFSDPPIPITEACHKIVH